MIPGVAGRIQQLPFTAYQRDLAIILGACFAVDTVDLTMMSFLLAPLTQDLGLTRAQAGLAGSAVFAGVGLGASAAGALSDRYGRKAVLLASMALWGFASLLTASSWNLASFMSFRVLTGLGLGAEFPIVFTLVAELMPADRRTRITGWMQAGAAASGLLFTAASSVAVGSLGAHLGWRVMSVALCLGSAFAILVWRRLPESPGWQAANGREAEAEASVARIEAAVASRWGRPLPPADPLTITTPATAATRGFRLLFTQACRGRTLFAWALWFTVLIAYYGVSVWLGKILVDRGMSLAGSIRTGVLITSAGLPAAWFTGRAMEMFGRKPVIVAVLLGLSGVALVYGDAKTLAALVAAGAAMQMFLAAIATALYAYTPELFPTEARASGLGSSSTAGRIAAIAGPLLIPILVSRGGYAGAFACCAACFTTAAILVLLAGPETRPPKQGLQPS